jgi:hypothetical protein
MDATNNTPKPAATLTVSHSAAADMLANATAEGLVVALCYPDGDSAVEVGRLSRTMADSAVVDVRMVRWEHTCSFQAATELGMIWLALAE